MCYVLFVMCRGRQTWEKQVLPAQQQFSSPQQVVALLLPDILTLHSHYSTPFTICYHNLSNDVSMGDHGHNPL